MANAAIGRLSGMKKVDLTKDEAELLKLIVAGAPISFEEIRRKTGFEDSKLVGIVGPLLRANLVARVPQKGKRVTHGESFEPTSGGEAFVRASGRSRRKSQKAPSISKSARRER